MMDKMEDNEHEGLRHVGYSPTKAVLETERTYVPCKHCDWLLEAGELHHCEECGQLHTPESTWEESVWT